MTEITDYTSSTALRSFFTSRSARAASRAFALESFVLDWAATGAIEVFKGPGSDPTTLTDYGSAKLWLRTNTGVNATVGSVRRWNGTSPASDEANWPVLTKSTFLSYLGFDLGVDADNVEYTTRTAATAATVPSGLTYLYVNGFASLSDGGEGLYKKLGSTPSPVELWHFQSADGAYWELIPENGSLNVKALGATGDGTTNDQAALQAAMDYWDPFAATTTGGGNVFLPPGIYSIDSSLTMSNYHGIKVIGSGPQSTEIKATGDFPIFTATGTSGTPLNKAAIEGMTLRGSGKANTSCYGIAWTWCNGCQIKDVVIYACRYGLYLAHQWQTLITDLDIHGQGSDQNYTGVYLAESTTSFVDNAVICSNSIAKDCEADGFRILNGQGSKWSNCEAGACATGWNIGNVSAGPPPCQWMHFANCLGDSCTQYNWLLQAGSAAYVGNMSLTGCWSGNATLNGIGITSGLNIAITGGVYTGNTDSGIYLNTCENVSITGGVFIDNNEDNSATEADITISAGQYNVVSGCVLENSVSKPNVLELNATNSNLFVGNQMLNGGTVIGSATKCVANTGLLTEVNGSTTFPNAATTHNVTHGLSVTPTADDIVLMPRASLAAAGLEDLHVSATSSTTFTITANTTSTAAFTCAYMIRAQV
jgi:hypothetical protein